MVGLILQTEAGMGSQNATLTKLKAGINVVRKVKLALAYRFAEGKLQF